MIFLLALTMYSLEREIRTTVTKINLLFSKKLICRNASKAGQVRAFPSGIIASEAFQELPHSKGEFFV